MFDWGSAGRLVSLYSRTPAAETVISYLLLTEKWPRMRPELNLVGNSDLGGEHSFAR